VCVCVCLCVCVCVRVFESKEVEWRGGRNGNATGN